MAHEAATAASSKPGRPRSRSAPARASAVTECTASTHTPIANTAGLGRTPTASALAAAGGLGHRGGWSAIDLLSLVRCVGTVRRLRRRSYRVPHACSGTEVPAPGGRCEATRPTGRNECEGVRWQRQSLTACSSYCMMLLIGGLHFSRNSTGAAEQTGRRACAAQPPGSRPRIRRPRIPSPAAGPASP